MIRKTCKKGVTFISVLVAFLILAVGVITLLKVYPVIDKLSGRAKKYVSFSMIADRVFVLIEEVYGDAEGPAAPSFFSGVDSEFTDYSYAVSIEEEEKAGLYRVEAEITRREEGRNESRCFYGSFRRK